MTVKRYAHCTDCNGNERLHPESPCRACQWTNDGDGAKHYVALEDYNALDKANEQLHAHGTAMYAELERLRADKSAQAAKAEKPHLDPIVLLRRALTALPREIQLTADIEAALRNDEQAAQCSKCGDFADFLDEAGLCASCWCATEPLDEQAAQVEAVAPIPESVKHVAWHIGKAVEYIEKVWPDAKMLDRGPILRNMRNWHKQLTAAIATQQPSTGEGS